MLDTDFSWITDQTVPALLIERKRHHVAYQLVLNQKDKREVSLHQIHHNRYLHINKEKYPEVWSIRLCQYTSQEISMEFFQLVVTPGGEVVLDDLGVPCVSDNIWSCHPWNGKTEQYLRQYIPAVEALAKRLLPLAQLYILSDNWQTYGDPSKPFTHFHTIG